MTHYAVELTGTSPLLMNAARVEYEKLNDWPRSDGEAAERKIYREWDGEPTLPRWSILEAIAREGRIGAPKLIWPDGINALMTWDWVRCGPVSFAHAGEWTVHTMHGVGESGGLKWSYPRFRRWSASFVLSVDESKYEADDIHSALWVAGKGAGLGLLGDDHAAEGWARFVVSQWQEVPSSRPVAAGLAKGGV